MLFLKYANPALSGVWAVWTEGESNPRCWNDKSARNASCTRPSRLQPNYYNTFFANQKLPEGSSGILSTKELHAELIINTSIEYFKEFVNCFYPQHFLFLLIPNYQLYRTMIRPCHFIQNLRFFYFIF